MAENENGPKDITPNPMDDAEKKAVTPDGAPAEPAAPVEAPEPEPKDMNEAMQTSILATQGFSRAIQFILAVAGLFGIFLGIKGQNFMAVEASLGSFLLSLSVLMDIFTTKKFMKDTEKISMLSRYVLAGVLFLLAALFMSELIDKMKMPMPANKNFLLAALIIMVIMFSIDFVIYARKNKEKLLADIYMFISVILSVLAAIAFVYYYVIPSFVLVGSALVLLIMSITKDPLKDDGRYNTRLTVTSAILLIVLAILAYAATIFYEKPIDVMLYGTITPSYSSTPANLSWSGDSWSFAFDLSDSKKKTSSLNIMNALSMGMTTLPPGKISEASQQTFDVKVPFVNSNKEKIEENLSEKLRPIEDNSGNTVSSELKLPQFIDRPVWNRKGNFLVFTGGDTEDGPRSIWGVSLQLSLYDKFSKDHKKVVEDEDGNTKEVMLSDEEAKADKEADMTQEEKVLYEAKLNELKYKKNDPVGKPKVLLADINVIIDKACASLTHKTAWSPDAKQFVFNAPDKKGRMNVWTSDTSEESINQVTKGDPKIMPLWSPTGEKLLYCTKTESYPYLKISDYDGSHSHELNAERDKDIFPLWNSEESRVIYYKKGKLIIMNANATEQQELSRRTLTPSNYWLTEKKKKILLEFTDSGTIWRIFTINPNGKKNKKIFEEMCDNLIQPKWSYDGRAIVTGINYGKESSLMRMDKDGKLKTKLYTTRSGHEISELEWSPTSEKIAFIVKKKSIPSMWFDRDTHMEELWVVDNDATKPIYLYTATGTINHMSWDDQGKRIAFDETYNAPYFIPAVTNIKIVHAIGAEKWTLLPYEFHGEAPTWSNDGNVLAYISWNDFWFPSPGRSRIWIAQLQ